MYSKYFGFASMPFDGTADPRFFFRTAEHEEALAALLYGVTQRRGITLVSGPPGSGKTLLGQMLIQQLRPQADVAVIGHAAETGHDLLQALCRELNLRYRPNHSTGDLVERLRAHLHAAHQAGRCVVAVIDEAQNMTPEVLEFLRMLGNFEQDAARLLQIVLLGQPGLTETLHRGQMDQLRQRIFCSCQLKPLERDQTTNYLRHRLRVAEAPDPELFTDDAVELIHERSRGLPRLINQIADAALLTAYGASRERVDRETVVECLQDMMTVQLAAPAGTAPPPACVAPVAADSAVDLGGSIHRGGEVIGRLDQVPRSAEHRIAEMHQLLNDLNAAQRTLEQTRDQSLAAAVESDARTGRLRETLATVNAAADRLLREKASVRRMLKSADRQVHEFARRTLSMQRERERLAGAGRSISGLLDKAASMRRQFDTGAAVAEDLRQLISKQDQRSAEMQAALEQSMRGCAQQIETLHRTVEQSGAQISQQTDQARAELGQRAGHSLAEVSGEIARHVEQAVAQVREQADACLRRLESGSQEQNRALEEAMTRGNAICDQLGEATRQAADLVVHAADAVGQLSNGIDRAEPLAAALTATEGLGDLVAEGRQVVETIDKSIVRAREELNTLSTQWLGEARDAEETVVAAGRAVLADMTARRSELETRFTEAESHLAQLRENLRAERERMDSGIEETGRRLQSHLEQAGDLVAMRITQAQAAAEAAGGRCDELRQAIQAGDLLNAALRDTGAHEELLARTHDIRDSLTRVAKAADQRLVDLENRMSEVCAAADAQAESLQRLCGTLLPRAGEQLRVLEEAAATADEKTRSVRETSRELVAEAEDAGKKLHDINIRASGLIERLDELGEITALIEQGRQFREDLVATITDAGQIGDRIEALESQAARTLPALIDRGEQARGTTVALAACRRDAELAAETCHRLTRDLSAKLTEVDAQLGRIDQAVASADRQGTEIAERLSVAADNLIRERAAAEALLSRLRHPASGKQPGEQTEADQHAGGARHPAPSRLAETSGRAVRLTNSLQKILEQARHPGSDLARRPNRLMQLEKSPS